MTVLSLTLLSLSPFSNENKSKCFKASRTMTIVSNPVSPVYCQYSPNYSWKAAIMVPYFAQWNVSMFSQWIQGWFVWISLINCSHLNYWCSSVKPAFPMTDGLCYQVIFPLGYSSLSSSISFPFQHFYSKVAKGLLFPTPFPSPVTSPVSFSFYNPYKCTPFDSST